jgi:hypothetical protein
VTGPLPSLYDLIRDLQHEQEMESAAAAGASKTARDLARLLDELAARQATKAEKLDRIVALLPQRPGRPELEKTPESFLQLVRELKEVRGWGRGRITVFMRKFGVSEWQVRQELERLAGENRCSSPTPGANVGGDRSRKRRAAQERSEGR